jgi:hypothetical protein
MFESIKKLFMNRTPASPFKEIGVAGAKTCSGEVFEEFLPELRGYRGRKTYREMRDNDATINSILFAIEMVFRSIPWTVEENAITKGTKEAIEAADFLESVLFDDMSHSWDDFITDVLSMLTFGWEYTEIVYKRRLGPNYGSTKGRSIFNDGKIGVYKLANRAQETLYKWDIDDQGNVKGLWQEPPYGGDIRYIPMSKAMLFRPHPWKGSPEGRSPLRGAYRSWYFLKNIQEIEAIAIERELAGLPVIYLPNNILNGTTADAIASRNEWLKAVRDIKFNEQGGLLVPSDRYVNKDGTISNENMFKVELLSSSGSRAISTNDTILRYERGIARTVLADFIMLGSNETGSFALSENKTALFIRSLEGWLESIAKTVNRGLVTKLWTLNNFDPNYIPYVNPGQVAPTNLVELGKYVDLLSKAGIDLSGDIKVENELRTAANFPEKPETEPVKVDADAVPLD